MARYVVFGPWFVKMLPPSTTSPSVPVADADAKLIEAAAISIAAAATAAARPERRAILVIERMGFSLLSAGGRLPTAPRVCAWPDAPESGKPLLIGTSG